MSGTYYNEIDPFAVAWLRELIKCGHLSDGVVDDRDIRDVSPADLVGFTRCHFFAGIGGWDYALQLAGWDAAAPVWTGSCPCQPFSAAGKGAGFADERDLWPAWHWLIRECRPPVVFGEQVEAAIGHGWLDRLWDDLEGEGYAVGAVGLPAACVGAFHIRQRLWFVGELANAASTRWVARSPERCKRPQEIESLPATRGTLGNVAQSQGEQHHGGGDTGGGRGELADGGTGSRGMAHPPGERRTGQHPLLRGEAAGRESREVLEVAGGGEAGELGDPSGPGLPQQRGERGTPRHAAGTNQGEAPLGAGAPTFWDNVEWLPCTDGKARPVEPGTFPLAHGVPARVGRLRGYGNAIVPQVAAEVIKAYLLDG